MKQKIYLLLFFVFVFLNVYSQHATSVCGEIDYVVPETQTLAEAKRNAIAQARLKAIADEFGTIVSQANTMAMHNTDGKSSSSFNSYSENEVRGIWLEDTSEPRIEMSYENEKDMLIIHAKACGKAREIKTVATELEIKTLNYGYQKGYEHPVKEGEETTIFKNNDFFGVQFKSPVKGYVALFLRDDTNDTIYTLLPYAGGDGYAREVKSNKEYTFLSNKDPEYPVMLPATILVSDRAIVMNTLIVVFSEKKFHVSLSQQGAFFPEIHNAKFQQWLHKMRNVDKTLQVQEIVLTIKK